MKRYFLTLGLLLAGVAAQPALADSFFLVGTNAPGAGGAPCSVSVPCGEVTITTSGNTATFTVSSLLDGYVFNSFGFNFNGAGSLSLVTTPPASAPSGELGSAPSLGGAGNEDGWGSFMFNFDTDIPGGSRGSDCSVVAGVPGAGCTFSFTVMDSLPGGLTPSEFEVLSSGDTGSGFFAGHVAAANASGFIGDSVPTTSPVPEPSSLMLLGTGALTLAGVIRRRYGH